MARWAPGARERLLVAAMERFTEQGYDATTVTEIAERAGVTKSTFFRHFPDKRALLEAGQETLSTLLVEGIAAAPDDAGPLDAVAAGLERASDAMGEANRKLWPRLQAAAAASAELQARDAMKSVGLAAARTDARSVTSSAARSAATTSCRANAATSSCPTWPPAPVIRTRIGVEPPLSGPGP